MMIRTSTLITGCLLGLLGLAHIAVGDPWDDLGDDLSTGATVLPDPTESVQIHGEHTLSNTTDVVDWFKFIDLSAGTTYLFEGTGSSDTEGFLYSNPNNSAVAYNDEDGEASNFLIVYTPISTGDVYLKVQEWSGGDAAYTLSYKIALDAWDIEDDTGSGAAFRLLDEYAYSEGPHTLTETDPSDWYQFNLMAGNTYRFETTGDWNTYGQLFSDAAGSVEVASADNGGYDLNCLLDYTPLSSGSFYLKLTQISEMENGEEYAEYDLQYSLIQDEWDSADDVGTGGTDLSDIDETLRMHGPHALSSTDEYDWFKIHLTAGNTYRFESTGGSDTEGYLFSDSA